MAKLKAKSKAKARQAGAGFFTDVWRGIKSVGKFIKDKKLISTIASVLPVPGAAAISKITSVAGLGRQRKMKGGRKLGGPGYVNTSVMNGGGKRGTLVLHGQVVNARSTRTIK
jgi:hypothetical protein